MQGKISGSSIHVLKETSSPVIAKMNKFGQNGLQKNLFVRIKSKFQNSAFTMQWLSLKEIYLLSLTLTLTRNKKKKWTK